MRFKGDQRPPRTLTQRTSAAELKAKGGEGIENTIVDVYNTHVNSRDVIAALEADGWREVAQKGSHKQFRHPTKPGRVTVVHPKRDIPVGTLRSIERQAGLRFE